MTCPHVSLSSQYYIDGGFSSMQPFPPAPCSRDTLTVSPFSGDTDICPADSPCLWDMVVSGSTLKGNRANSVRIINALYPLGLEVSCHGCGWISHIHSDAANGEIHFGSACFRPDPGTGFWQRLQRHHWLFAAQRWVMDSIRDFIWWWIQVKLFIKARSKEFQ